jgi:hypothetical protein
MIAFTMVMLDELVQGPSEVALPNRNHAVKAFVLDRSHEALRAGIAVQCLERVCPRGSRNPRSIPNSPETAETVNPDSVYVVNADEVSRSPKAMVVAVAGATLARSAMASVMNGRM